MKAKLILIAMFVLTAFAQENRLSGSKLKSLNTWALEPMGVLKVVILFVIISALIMAYVIIQMRKKSTQQDDGHEPLQRDSYRQACGSNTDSKPTGRDVFGGTCHYGGRRGTQDTYQGYTGF